MHPRPISDREDRSIDTAAAAQRRPPVFAIGLIVLGFALRVYHLFQPMRYDEAVTYLYFATRPWLAVFASYRYPNNHILHTALVKAVSMFLGNAPWAIRMPAFVFGVATLVLTFAVGRRLVGERAAWIGTAIVAASGPLILYSTNARGYSLVGCATLVMLLLLLRLRERCSRVEWIGVIAAAALGLWTIPVMLYPAGGLALWFFWSALIGDTSDGKKDARRLVVAVLGTAVVTCLMYAPVLLAQGAQPIVGNQFVTASDWPGFFRDLVSFTPALVTSWSIGIPRFVTILLLLFALGGEVVSRQRRQRRVSLAGTMSLWCVALLLLTHRVPFVRVALFALPLMALVAGLGLATLLERALPARRADFAVGFGAAGLAALLGASVLLSRGVLTSTETGTLRDAQAITTFLGPNLRPGDRVLAPVPSSAPLSYYFMRAGLDAQYLSATPRPDGHVYLVVNVAEGFTLDSPLRGEPYLQRFVDARLIHVFPEAPADSSVRSAELYQLLPATPR